jgi:hypothetical protein
MGLSSIQSPFFWLLYTSQTQLAEMPNSGVSPGTRNKGCFLSSVRASTQMPLGSLPNSIVWSYGRSPGLCSGLLLFHDKKFMFRGVVINP